MATPRRLRDKRKQRVLLHAGFIILACFVLIGIAIALSWREEVRIRSVSVSGAIEIAPHEVARHARQTLRGQMFFVFPRDSIFWYPKNILEASIAEAFPRIATLSIQRSGMAGITLGIKERIPAGLWCGESRATATTCLVLDDEGFIFDSFDGTTIYPRLYGPLLFEDIRLGNVLLRKGAITRVLDLMETLNRNALIVESVEIRAPDEADIYLANGIRIMYVLGQEEYIAETLQTVLDTVASGRPVEYIDMRFGNRVYVKRRD